MGTTVIDMTSATTTETIPTGSTDGGSADNTGTGVSIDINAGSEYKDGTYTTTGDYYSPGGAEQLQVTLTLKDDIVTDASVVSLATRPESKMYQGKFISGFKSYVVGKKLDEVSVTKVSGSSLSPKGFMDAVAKVKADASA
jgi:uncharacterized protein with FMN-binding domain